MDLDRSFFGNLKVNVRIYYPLMLDRETTVLIILATQPELIANIRFERHRTLLE